MGIKDLLFGRGEGSGPPLSDDADTRTHAALDAFWRGVGAVEGDVLGHVISPSFMGGPAWPTTRQAYRVVRRPASILLATDGMADPFRDGQPGNGFGLELFIDTPNIPAAHAGGPGVIDPLKYSWAFEVLQNIAALVAGAGGLMPQLERHGVLSVEVPGVSGSNAVAAQVPSRFVTADDALGVLINGPAPDFATTVPGTPLSPVVAVPLVLITARELDHVRAHGGEGRRTVTEALARSTGHRVVLDRAEVV
jgi:hypothetical protein